MSFALPSASEPFVDPKTGVITRAWLPALTRAMEASLSDWQELDFDAARFTASGAMTWTVAAADVVQFAYKRVGQTLIVAFTLSGTDIAGVPDLALRIGLPKGLLLRRQVNGLYTANDNGAVAAAKYEGLVDTSYVSLYRNVAGTGNWAAAAATTGVSGVVVLETK